MKPLLRNTINSLLLSVLAAVPCGCSNNHNDAAASSQTAEKADTTAAAKAGMCKHDSPDKDCFICHPELREKGRLWCKEHDRYEDRCWLCHPELQDKNRLYCKEHSLYEDECFLCHPELKKETAPAGEKGGAAVEAEGKPVAAALMCKEHGVAEQECGICHPELLGQSQMGLKVRLPSAESARKAGVIVGTPGVDRMQQGVECFAEITFNQNKLAQITPLVGGVVKSVEVDLGSRVKAGDLLARITSMAIGEAQSAYLKALAEDKLRDKTLERERNLRAQRISSEKDLQEAEAAHQAAMAALQQARQHLMVLGFDDQQLQALSERKLAPGVLEIRAPFSGEIVERAAVQGALAEMGKPLLTLADTTALWAMVKIPESQIALVRVGQNVNINVESLVGETFSGKLTWLAAKVDERTRMARGRVELTNPDGRLKAQMFARALIVTSNSEGAVVVPQSALQNVSGTPLVFVKSSDDLFEVRPVQVGAKHNGHVQIVAGLKQGEPIVVAGSFALKSQFLISRLGAGCVDD